MGAQAVIKAIKEIQLLLRQGTLADIQLNSYRKLSLSGPDKSHVDELLRPVRDSFQTFYDALDLIANYHAGK